MTLKATPAPLSVPCHDCDAPINYYNERPTTPVYCPQCGAKRFVPGYRAGLARRPKS